MAAKAKLADKVRLLMNVMSDFEGKLLMKGQVGTVSNVNFSPERYQVDFASDERGSSDGIAFCSVTLKPDQFELVTHTPPPAKKTYSGGMREIE